MLQFSLYLTFFLAYCNLFCFIVHFVGEWCWYRGSWYVSLWCYISFCIFCFVVALRANIFVGLSFHWHRLRNCRESSYKFSCRFFPCHMLRRIFSRLKPYNVDFGEENTSQNNNCTQRYGYTINVIPSLIRMRLRSKIERDWR